MPRPRASFIQSTLTRLMIGFVVLVGIVGMNFWLSARSQVLFEDVVAARDARSSAVELRNELVAAESSARGFQISGNEIYLSPYGRAKTLADRQLAVVTDRFQSYPEMAPAIERLKRLLQAKFAEMDTGLALKRDRKDDEARALFDTNRGKALMDEANVFLSGLVRAADQQLIASAASQRANADWLRWVSIAGGVIVVLVVGSAAFAIFRYTSELREARDHVTALNERLETRVRERTEELENARDRAELLLAEVNHRVANSIALVSSLVALQTHAVNDPAAKQALSETQARLLAVATIHRSLYTSGEVKAVSLDVYLAELLDHLKQSLGGGGEGLAILYDIAPVQLSLDASVSLGVVVTEWVTNAIKYAYPEGSGEIRVTLKQRSDGGLALSVADRGVGRQEGTPAQGTGLGTRIVRAMAASLRARIDYETGRPGTIARITLEPGAIPS